MIPTRVFVGFDPRQPLAYNVAQSSIHRHAKGRVIVEPLMLSKLPITRRGLTEFTYSRFIVPWLCRYEGAAIFLDPDTATVGDIAELAAEADGISSVQVMQDQPKFEWASVMLFNNANCRMLTPEFIDDESRNPLALDWGDVGTFSANWNVCVGYSDVVQGAKLFHYTQGLPCWHETEDCANAHYWQQERDEISRTCDWATLMAKSVHAQPVIKRMLLRYGIKVA